MMRINVVKNGLFLVPKSSLTEYLNQEVLCPELLEKKVSRKRSRISGFVNQQAIPAHTAVKRETVRSLVNVLGRKQGKTWRILDYLASQKTKEVVAQFCTDLELSWFTVLRASEGNPDPWNFSFWMFFGKTYPKALKAWAQRDAINQKALDRCAAMVRAEKEKKCQTIAAIALSADKSPICVATENVQTAARSYVMLPVDNLYRTALQELKKPSAKRGKKVA